MDKLNVLITGHKGFIGSHLWATLEKTGKYNLDGLEKTDNPHKFKNCYFHYIFHLAAVARTSDCIEDPFGQSYDSNVELTKILLKEYIYEKIIYTSSCSIYGNYPHMITDTSPTVPVNIYGWQKLFSEKLIEASKKPYVILRLFNTYGPGQSKEGKYPNVIASMIRDFRETGLINIYGDGKQTRDFIYIDDVVNALITSMWVDSFQPFNICTNQSYSLVDVAKMITSNINFHPARPNDIYQQQCWSETFKRYGWEPKTSLEEGIQKQLNENISNNTIRKT